MLVNEEGRRVERVFIQKKMADAFFRLSYNSFTIICSHANFFFLFFLGGGGRGGGADKTRKAVNAIYLLISL